MPQGKSFNVSVLGAAGGVGQSVSLFLKLDPQIHTLNLFDVTDMVKGTAVDLGHIDTAPIVKSFIGDTKDNEKQEQALAQALKGVDVTVITSGVPQKPGESRDDTFDKNAKIILGLVDGISKNCPKSMICVVSNPVNSLVPLIAERLKQNNTYDEKRLFGVSRLDTIRARTFLGHELSKDPSHIDVEVIGGHSNETILPLLSSFRENLSDEKIKMLHNRVQNAADEVIDAKAGHGSATLSTGYAVREFISALLAGMAGEKRTTTAFVQSNLIQGCNFFSSRITIAENGIEKIHELPELSEFEKSELDNTVISSLQKQIAKGANYMKSES